MLEPEPPHFDTKHFIGWYDQEDASLDNPSSETKKFDGFGKININDSEDKEFHLYAKYEAVVYVQFMHLDKPESEGGRYQVFATKEVLPGETTDGNDVPVITWPGKVFAHWSLEPNGDEFNFEEQPISKDTTLYAVLLINGKLRLIHVVEHM